jgi:acyl-CoA dehydrogenase
MRSIGAAELALAYMCRRLMSRTTFGKRIADRTVWHERIAQSRCMIDQARLMTLKAAQMMDTVGNKAARAEIAMIKVIAPQMAGQVVDWAIQAHGGAGLTGDFPLAYMYSHQRALRIIDGPDEVHWHVVGRAELARYEGDNQPTTTYERGGMFSGPA